MSRTLPDEVERTARALVMAANARGLMATTEAAYREAAACAALEAAILTYGAAQREGALREARAQIGESLRRDFERIYSEEEDSMDDHECALARRFVDSIAGMARAAALASSPGPSPESGGAPAWLPAIERLAAKWGVYIESLDGEHLALALMEAYRAGQRDARSAPRTEGTTTP